MKVVLIGPGDIEKHSRILNRDLGELEEELRKIGKTLAELDVELVLLPDRGVSYLVAKYYKANGGKKVYGTIPLSDKEFGIKHLESYRDVIDEEIDTKDWFRQDLMHCLFGHCILCLGFSLGSIGELSYAYYLYKLFKGKKPEVRVESLKRLHPDIVAGEIDPYPVIIYKPFVAGPLQYELKQYIEDVGGKVVYVSNVDSLKQELENLRLSK